MGFDVTAPISCVSAKISEIDDVYVYIPKEKHPKGEEALKSFKAYLNAVNKKYEIVEVDPCNENEIFKMVLNMKEKNLICGGSGLRVLGIALTLACIMSKSECFISVNYEGGGTCINVKLGEIPFKRKEESLIYSYLKIKGAASLDELSKALQMNKKTLWKILVDMEDRGLVKRVKRGTYAASNLF